MNQGGGTYSDFSSPLASHVHIAHVMVDDGGDVDDDYDDVHV